MQPLRVTAWLRHAYIANDPWSPSLDGLLAYLILREQLPEEEFIAGMSGLVSPVIADLSAMLAREEDGAGHWWWVCSSPVPAQPLMRFPVWFHRRFDAGEAAARVDPRVRRVETAGGAYKNYRQRRMATATASLTWHCVGEAGALTRMLRRCYHVGHRLDAGFGEVTGWEVTASGADERLARLHRPLPVAWATARGVGGMVLDWGIIPPGRWPAHRTLCVMPHPMPPPS